MPGATVSLVLVRVRAGETFPATSRAVTEIVTAPSVSDVALIPVTVTVPEPVRDGEVFDTDWEPRVSVTVSVSDASAEDGTPTPTEILARFARLMYALPDPPPLARVTELGWAGAALSAVAVAVVLSRLCSAGEPVESARRR